MTAVNTLRGVHTLQSTAFWTYPSLALRFDECLNTDVMDPLEVLKHAHPVLRAVTAVEAFEARTWEVLTFGTEARFARPERFTVANRTCEDGLGLAFIFGPAAKTPILTPEVAHAQAAVHAARRNQFRFQRLRRQLLPGFHLECQVFSPPVGPSCRSAAPDH